MIYVSSVTEGSQSVMCLPSTPSFHPLLTLLVELSDEEPLYLPSPLDISGASDALVAYLKLGIDERFACLHALAFNDKRCDLSWHDDTLILEKLQRVVRVE